MEKALRMYGIPYVSQYRITGMASVDIFVEPNICIFVDGDYYHNYPMGNTRDRRVSKLLRKWDYIVYRFWEHDILENSDKLVEKIITENKLKYKNNMEEFFNED
jgi:very-short-patch-repair endonuclease